MSDSEAESRDIDSLGVCLDGLNSAQIRALLVGIE